MQKEFVYEIGWLEATGRKDAVFSESCGKKVLNALRSTCGAYSHRMIPIDKRDVIRNVNGFVLHPLNNGVKSEICL